MNSKYFSRALFYDERSNIAYSALAYSVIFLISILDFTSSLHTLQFIMPNPHYANIALTNFPSPLMLIFAITTVCSSYNRKDVKYSFMLTQPYSRDTIIITKTAACMAGFTVTTVLYGIISFALISYNRIVFGELYKPLMFLLFYRLFALFAMLTFAVMLVQLMQMLFGKSSAAFLIPLVLGFMFATSLGLIYEFTSTKLPFMKNLMKEVLDFLFKYKVVTEGSVAYKGVLGKTAYYMETSDFSISVILLLLSCAIFYICILLNRRIKAEATAGLFLFRFSETIFKVITSVFSVVFMTLLFLAAVMIIYQLITGNRISADLARNYGIDGKKNIEDTVNLIINILWIPLMILAYRFLGFIFNKRRSV
jgi:hypothetical protein